MFSSCAALGEKELTCLFFSDPFPRFIRIRLHCEFDFCEYFEERGMRYKTGKCCGKSLKHKTLKKKR